MYTEFYNLHSKPFQISSDPKFMWFGEKHKEALATLKYGILDNKGFLLLTGDVGTGKTSLINTLIQSLGKDIICASVPDPSLDKLDFLNYISASFGMDKEFSSKGSFLAHFRSFLMKAWEKKKKVLLIIDEAQLLNQEMLEEIRLLSNIEKADAKLINIFFIGQNEFNEILNRPQNRAVRQRMTLNYNLDPLTPDETGAYIRHRLKIAGTKEQLFDQGAVQEIFLYSGGFPRRINILCDHSLLSGFVKEQKSIDAGIITECAKELKIPAYVRNRDINGYAASLNQQTAEINSGGYPTEQRMPPQPPSYPQYPPAPPPQEKSFSWTNIIIILFFIIFAWSFMFPDHFLTKISNLKHLLDKPIQITQSVEKKVLQDSEQDKNKGEIIEETAKTSNNQTGTDFKENNLIEPEIDLTIPAIPEETTEPLHDNEQEKMQEVLNEKSSDLAPVLFSDPEIDLPPLPEDTIILRFKYNTNELTEKGIEQLRVFSKLLIGRPDTRILIIGYTDSQGYAKYNLKLSEFRANIIKSFLQGMGVKSDQMEIQGKGGRDPIESNDTPWGRKMNRRVEIKVL